MSKLSKAKDMLFTLACWYIILRGFIKLDDSAKTHNGYLMIEAFVYLIIGCFVVFNHTKPVQKD